MPTTRELVETTESFKRFLVRGDDGQEIGTDVETIPTPEQVNGATLRGRVATGITTNATYLRLPTPRTNTQIAAQVEELTRQNLALGRLVAGLLNTTDGT